MKNDEFEFRESIGGLRYLTTSVYRGELLVHVREYRMENGKEVPTKKGVTFTKKRWASFLNWKNVIADKVGATKSNKPVDFSQHLGGKYYVGVNSKVKLVNLRKYVK